MATHSNAPQHRFLFAQQCDDGFVHVSFDAVEVNATVPVGRPVNMKLRAHNARELYENMGRCLARLEKQQKGGAE